MTSNGDNLRSPRHVAGAAIMRTPPPSHNRLSTPGSGDQVFQIASTYLGPGEHRVERKVAAILGRYGDLMENLSAHWDANFTQASEDQKSQKAAMDQEHAQHWSRVEHLLQQLSEKHEKKFDEFHTRTQQLSGKQEQRIEEIQTRTQQLFEKQEKKIEEFQTRTREMLGKQEHELAEQARKFEERMVSVIGKQENSSHKFEVLTERLTAKQENERSEQLRKIEETMNAAFRKQENNVIDFEKMTDKQVSRNEKTTKEFEAMAEKLFAQQDKSLKNVAEELGSQQSRMRELLKNDVTDGFALHNSMVNGMILAMKADIVSMRDELHYIKSTEESLRQVLGRAQKFDQAIVELQALPLRVQAVLKDTEDNVQNLQKAFESSSKLADDVPTFLKIIKKTHEACHKIVSTCEEGDSEMDLPSLIKQCREQLGKARWMNELKTFDSLFGEIFDQLSALGAIIGKTPRESPTTLLETLVISIKKVTQQCQRVQQEIDPGQSGGDGLLAYIAQCSATCRSFKQFDDNNSILVTWKDAHGKVKKLSESMEGDDPSQLIVPIRKAAKVCADASKEVDHFSSEQEDLRKQVMKCKESLSLLTKAEHQISELYSNVDTLKTSVHKVNKELSDNAAQTIQDAIKGCQQIQKMSEVTNHTFIERMREVKAAFQDDMWTHSELVTMSHLLRKTKEASEKFLGQVSGDSVSSLAGELRSKVEVLIESRTKDAAGSLRVEFEAISENTAKASKSLSEMIETAQLKNLIGEASQNIGNILKNANKDVDTFKDDMSKNAQDFGDNIKKVSDNIKAVSDIVEKVDRTVGKVLRWGKGIAGLAAGALTSGVLTLVGVLRPPPD